MGATQAPVQMDIGGRVSHFSPDEFGDLCTDLYPCASPKP